MNQRPKS